MNAEVRSRCMRRSRARRALSLLPLLIVGLLVWFGQFVAAGALFISVMATVMIGTLVPRCALFGPMIKQLRSGGNCTLLTIDDGPHPQHTPAILDILDEHRLKAVFFLVGERAAKHPYLVREIVARGHEIGNHTQTHPAAMFWALQAPQLWREISGCQETLMSICPEHPPRFFRPPAGHHNMFTSLIVQALGLRMLIWSARGFDGVAQNVDLITRRIRRRLKADSIVLIHEGTPVAVEVAHRVRRADRDRRLRRGRRG